MASKKEGGKNRKIGRHSRNPSSQQQAKRTERNKAHRAEKLVHIPPHKPNNAKVAPSGRHIWGFVEFRGKRVRVTCL